MSEQKKERRTLSQLIKEHQLLMAECNSLRDERIQSWQRIAKLEFLVAERDAMLGKRPCQNSRCNELNAARALLREALDTIEEFPDEDHEIADRIKEYLDACDKPGEPT